VFGSLFRTSAAPSRDVGSDVVEGPALVWWSGKRAQPLQRLSVTDGRSSNAEIFSQALLGSERESELERLLRCGLDVFASAHGVAVSR